MITTAIITIISILIGFFLRDFIIKNTEKLNSEKPSAKLTTRLKRKLLNLPSAVFMEPEIPGQKEESKLKKIQKKILRK